MFRAFIAIKIPGFIQGNILDFQQILRGEPFSGAIRFVPVDNIHLTVKFLGDIEQNYIPKILQALKGVAGDHPMMSIAVSEVGCFPNSRRPRVIWLGLQEPEGHLKHIHTVIEVEMERLGFKAEDRRFHPHLTLGRIKKSARSDQVSAIGQWVEQAEAPSIGVFQTQEIHLIQSKLTPQGAIYSPLGAAAFKGDA